MPELEVPTTRSSRSREDLRADLARWLGERQPGPPAPEVSELTSPSASGMSSETLLFDASWNQDGERHSGSFVGRLAPAPADVPTFPHYDLELQFRLLRLVAEHSDVPVPRVRWLELDPEPLGSPFFVMDRVAGRVPPDVLPYVFQGWLLEAGEADRKRLERESVGILAGLHAIDPARAGADFLAYPTPGDTPLRRHVAHWRDYYEWARENRRHPIIERGFAWLDDHWPGDEGETVISWGDSRIGNVMYEPEGFRPVAVLDWEMAGLGPRELDIGWLTFMHLFFDDIARNAGLPGMPDFLQPEAVASEYASRSGYRPRDGHFYEVYAAVRHAVIMTRVTARSVHFGEAEWPADPDSVIPHRAILERWLSGDPTR